MKNTFTLTKPVTLKAQAVWTAMGIFAAVMLPQVFHILGILTGTGTATGEIFLPMHLPVIFVGLIAGPWAGLITGLASPILSMAMTGMPTAVMMPFMVIELGIYGLSAGLLSNVKIPCFGKVVITQFAGRLVRALAILFAVNVLSYTGISTGIILASIVKGLPGLMLQWTLIPLLVYRLEGKK